MGHKFDVLKPDSGFQSLYKERRDCFKSVFDYVCSNHANGRICAIYGLRRTGKTVLMEQCIEALPSDMKNKCRLITCSRKTDFYELTEYIKEEIEKGNRYFL